MSAHAVPVPADRAALTSPRRAVGMLLVFVVLWSLIEDVAGPVLQHVTPWQTVWVRYTVHLLIVLALWGRPGARAPWRTARPGYQLGRSATMLVMPASWALAVAHGVSATLMLALFWCAPLLVLAFAALLLRERASAWTWFAAALGWVGAWLFFAPDAPLSVLAVLLSIAMAASFALYVVMTRGLRHEPLRTNLFFTAVVPWVALLPVLPRVWANPSPAEIGALIFIGAAGWVCLAALDRAADAAPVSHTAPMLHLQAAATALIAASAGHLSSMPRLLASTVLIGATAAITWIVLPPATLQEQA